MYLRLQWQVIEFLLSQFFVPWAGHDKFLLSFFISEARNPAVDQHHVDLSITLFSASYRAIDRDRANTTDITELQYIDDADQILGSLTSVLVLSSYSGIDRQLFSSLFPTDLNLGCFNFTLYCNTLGTIGNHPVCEI
jgi:hypothetical protein